MKTSRTPLGPFDDSVRREWIPLSKLRVVWPEAQRETMAANIAKLDKAGFDPDKLTDLVVAGPNEHGVYHVVDGLHRKTWLESLFGADTPVPCKVVSAMSAKRAAEIWRGINGGRTQPTPISDHQVAVTAGDPVACGVEEIIRKNGFRVTAAAADGGISAIQRCHQIFRKHGGSTLNWCLTTIRSTWGLSNEATSGNVLLGFAEFYAEHNGQFDQKRLEKMLAQRYTPARLIGAARQAVEMFRGSVAANVKRVITNCYDHGLRSGRLGQDAEAA